MEYKNFDLSISTYGALNYHVTDDIYNSLNSCYGWSNKDVAMGDANPNQQTTDKFTSDDLEECVIAAYTFADGDWFFCHGYSMAKNGAPLLIQKKILWTADGWPTLE